MPVRPGSRYYGVPVYDADGRDGEPSPTIGVRRPPAPSTEASYQHTVIGAETIESIAARYHGSSEAWWRIADDNPLVFPLDLKPGTKLVIRAPAERGTVVRTRRF